MALEITNLHVSTDDKEILKGITLTVQQGEIHVVMGPNGSGKSTLANSLMGHPSYEVTSGAIVVDGTDITQEDPDKRSKAGLFLSMQYPPEITGVTIVNFLRRTYEARTGERQNPMDFYTQLVGKMRELHIDAGFAKRYVNGGFSGGEKKKSEILQLASLDPTYAILDETDSGLDVDALKIVSDGINTFHNETKGIVLITHYNRILQYVSPDYVHIMVDGRIVKRGGPELAQEIEDHGYAQFLV